MEERDIEIYGTTTIHNVGSRSWTGRGKGVIGEEMGGEGRERDAHRTADNHPGLAGVAVQWRFRLYSEGDHLVLRRSQAISSVARNLGKNQEERGWGKRERAYGRKVRRGKNKRGEKEGRGDT